MIVTKTHISELADRLQAKATGKNGDCPQERHRFHAHRAHGGRGDPFLARCALDPLSSRDNAARKGRDWAKMVAQLLQRARFQAMGDRANIHVVFSRTEVDIFREDSAGTFTALSSTLGPVAAGDKTVAIWDAKSTNLTSLPGNQILADRRKYPTNCTGNQRHRFYFRWQCDNLQRQDDPSELARVHAQRALAFGPPRCLVRHQYRRLDRLHFIERQGDPAMKRDAGFTLLEVMISMLIGTIGLMGTIAVQQSIISASKNANDAAVAMRLASQKLEELSALNSDSARCRCRCWAWPAVDKGWQPLDNTSASVPEYADAEGICLRDSSNFPVAPVPGQLGRYRWSRQWRVVNTGVGLPYVISVIVTYSNDTGTPKTTRLDLLKGENRGEAWTRPGCGHDARRDHDHIGYFLDHRGLDLHVFRRAAAHLRDADQAAQHPTESVGGHGGGSALHARRGQWHVRVRAARELLQFDP